MERRTKKPSSRVPGIDQYLPADRIALLRPHRLSPSARQAEKEFDALLKAYKQKKK